jgi:Zn-dependent peptidase ImmA (M78 family)
MKNTFLSDKTAADIDTQVAKILRDLDNPEPPLRLEVVRELLKLDREYYSAANEGMMRELIHRLTVAGKQIVMRPTLLWDVIKKFDLKALYVPDRKRILLNSDLPSAKQRWNEAHETIHSIIPWHEYLMFGDDDHSLSPVCHSQIETEANYGAGRLLFLQDRFAQELCGSAIDLEAVRNLAKVFGNTITSTLWRTVEHMQIPAAAAISRHPHQLIGRAAASDPCRYFIRSKTFERKFGQVTELDFFRMMSGYCSARTRGPLGESEELLRDDNGDHHVFRFESFSNTYEVLTLAIHSHQRKIALATV